MREFDVESGRPPRWIRAFVAGVTSSGKTHFVATWPRPLILCDAIEGSWNTIPQMDPSLWWDPRVRPRVGVIERVADVAAKLHELETLSAQNRLPWRTLALDPLSIYSGRYLSEQMTKHPDKDNRQIYGELQTHLRALVIRFHALPMHIVWTSHVEGLGDGNGAPAIDGKMSAKFPAFSDFKWLCRAQSSPNGPPMYEMRTRPFGAYQFLGSRWPLPDPMIPSFKVVAQCLRLDEPPPASPAVPGYPGGVVYGAPALNGAQAAGR